MGIVMKVLSKSVIVILSLVMATSAWSGVNIQPSKLYFSGVLKLGSKMKYVRVHLKPGMRFVAVMGVYKNRRGENTVKAWLVTEENFRRRRAGKRYYYIKGAGGTVRKTGKIVYRATKEGDYYFLIRSGSTNGNTPVKLVVYTLQPRLTPEFLRERKFYDRMYRAYIAMFKSRYFDINVRVCGIKNAFSDYESNITICRELIIDLKRKGHGEAIKFILHHEFAHSLLKIWGWPLYDNEDVADEFATVLSLMFRQYKAPLAAARWWAKRPVSARYLRYKIRKYDRHTITIQRARNILKWMKEPRKLLKKWQKFLISNMTNAALKVLKRGWEKGTLTWVNIDVVRAEIARRVRLQRQCR